MKKYILVFLLIGSFTNAQEKLTFDYDTAGNQTNRMLICINCIDVITDELEDKGNEEDPKEDPKDDDESEDSTTEDPSKETAISYYPNPVKEELFIDRRQLSNENPVTTIAVYSLSGQAIKTQPIANGQNGLTLPFSEYPAGVYIVLISHKNGEDKSIKIMKQ
ncbi:T9SS type A sorting domain-containing protein [Flavobacterium hercynium]|uniref:Secretion system C-terminal sorting domain-containing protein n=1 Tax=Flavobacterium hercynium TaxID=387094 RepID=A0A226HBX7_9FLAO|nr:T9SS type A sorting domain-containing protein [Flavobacterium hercynium]OXA91692.1 hypothetical protein B0A66_11165 [Flavobacterium hercynium]SMP27455.1 Por secretion system C-terminal sorting domain-containing protein [Flavobacterium hercynium]